MRVFECHMRPGYVQPRIAWFATIDRDVARCERVTHRVFYSHEKLKELEREGLYGTKAGGESLDNLRETRGDLMAVRAEGHSGGFTSLHVHFGAAPVSPTGASVALFTFVQAR